MINLVVALPAEAKPLIDHFFLKPTHAKPFRVFSTKPRGGPAANSGGQNESVRLIISGMRKEKSARAVSFLYELSGVQDEVWINIGIAGHRDHAIETGVLAHKIIDLKTNESWYPAFVFHSPCATGTLLTVSRAVSRYQSPYVYEMEASGFYESALRYSTVELIHCYKIISDNSKSSHWKVTPRLAEQMIENRLSDITFLIAELGRRAESLSALHIKTEELEPFFKRWHFTVTQQFQLRRLLRRLKTFTSDQAAPNEFEALQNSSQVLAALNDRVRQVPVHL